MLVGPSCILYHFFLSGHLDDKKYSKPAQTPQIQVISSRPFYLCPLTQLNRAPCNLSPHELYVKLEKLKNKHKPCTDLYNIYIFDDILKTKHEYHLQHTPQWIIIIFITLRFLALPCFESQINLPFLRCCRPY